MKRLIKAIILLWVVFLACISTSVYADTYPAVTSACWKANGIGACQASANAACQAYYSENSNGTQCLYIDPSTHAVTPHGSVANTPALSCPNTGTLSGSSCISATACTSPQVRSSTTPYACGNPPVVACPSGQYAPLGSSTTASCVAVPNCNSSAPVDGKYFNINTASCVVDNSNITLCIDSVSVAGGQLPPKNFYCPPVSDCIPVSTSCTNNAIDTNAAQTVRASEVAAIKANADSKKAQADIEATTATSAKSAKDSVTAAALTAQTAAKSQSDSVASAPASTPAQILTAAQNYAAAVSDYTSAFAKSANSLLAAAAAQTAAGDAMNHTNAIPSANPGNGSVYGDMVSNDLGRAIVAAGDAVSGLGSGTGTGQGASAGTCTATNTCADSSGLAKDTTLATANTKLDGITNALAKDTVAYSASPSVRTIGDSLGLVSAKFRSKLPSVVFSDVSPDCPVFTKHIPFINVDLTIDSFCTMDSSIRPTLQAVSLFIYAYLAFIIVLGA